MPGIVLFLLLVLSAAAVGVKAYNTLQPLRLAVQKCSSNVDVALKKKMTLLNQLIDLVKNYQESEQFVQFKMAQDANAATLTGAYMQSGALFNSIQGVAERFPNLKASEQYTHLSHAVSGCEDNIQNAREWYNEAVEEYNAERLRIPTVFIAKFLGFRELNFHHADVSGLREATTLHEMRTGDGQRLAELLDGGNQALNGTGRYSVSSAGQGGGLVGSGIAHSQANGQAHGNGQGAQRPS